ncbi:GNAT family N-acetyltransferase [Actinoplanes sp. NPDC049316]|uniref:GNAT family N-acetyltransferase n=1 Tax=Actinoplanes sp. NPDC049316 TaxID=3154727 RepID=UPI003436A210
MIERLTPGAFADAVPDLAGLLVDAVAGGASVGFLAGFDHAAATTWWRERAAAVAGGSLVVWVHRDPHGITGTISLAYAEKPNARHRAEIVKLAVHRAERGRGLGRKLLATAQEQAAASGITLLLLDTETDSPADRLYRTAGWQRYGVVPGYAAGPEGELKACSFYYKTLGPGR